MSSKALIHIARVKRAGRSNLDSVWTAWSIAAVTLTDVNLGLSSAIDQNIQEYNC